MTTQTIAEALAAWDAGEIVQTVEMGGMGPGYEQAIQIAVFEFVRSLLADPPDFTTLDLAKDAGRDSDAYRNTRAYYDRIEADAMGRLAGAGMTGAQVGAAQNVAYRAFRLGSWAAMLDSMREHDKDRLMMVSRTWPHPPAPAPNAFAGI